MEPRTAAGRALHEAFTQGWTDEQWTEAIRAIEAEARAAALDEARAAVLNDHLARPQMGTSYRLGVDRALAAIEAGAAGDTE